MDEPAAEAALIIFPGALGDLVCLGPAIRALLRGCPDCPLELMARAELARFAVGRMGISAGHSIDRREMSLLFAQGGDQESTRKFFRRFRRVHSFFAADNSLFRGALAAAAGGPVSFHPFRPPDAGHVAQGYLRSIGADAAASPESRIEPSPEDIAAASGHLARIGLRPGEFVLIFPGSGSRAKNWPAENYAALAARVSDMIAPLIVLGPAERDMRMLFESRSIPVIDDLELGEAAGLAALARCFIGNDSGVSHLAAACGAPGVALFGPTDPSRWAPLGEIAIIRRQPLEGIEPGEVLAAIGNIAGSWRDSKDRLWRPK
jgi:ADP-heptose:LPS heptosyltransferase